MPEAAVKSDFIPVYKVELSLLFEKMKMADVLFSQVYCRFYVD